MITLEYGVLLNIILTIASIVFFVAKIDGSTKMYKEVFTIELKHLKEELENNKRDIKEDIQRLDQKQSESNRVKERLCLCENAIKSMHKRMDQYCGGNDL